MSNFPDSTHLNQFTKNPKALIVGAPWAKMIVAGEKIWEMRSRPVSMRGVFAVAEKGTGCLIGLINLVECNGPHDDDYLFQHTDHHRGSREDVVKSGYRYSWEFKGASLFTDPIPYQHKNGAVVWVSLEADVVDNVLAQFGYPGLARQSPLAVAPEGKKNDSNGGVGAAKDNVTSVTTERVQESLLEPTASSRQYSGLEAPKAKDGSIFDPHTCLRNGVYKVGEKGAERNYNDYYEALSYLRSMKTAVWRRPNANGNWGGVRAVEWVPLK